MKAVQIFLVVVGIASTQVSAEACNNYEDCVRDIKHSKQPLEQVVYSEFVRNLEIRSSIANSIRNLQNDVSAGPKECTIDLNNVVAVVRAACGTVEYSVDSKIAQEILSYPEDYLENNNEEERKSYCDNIVPVINNYCEIFDVNKKSLDECNILEKFEEIYRNPWLDCVNNME